MTMQLATCTALFCDISESTRYASVMGEREYGELLQAYQEIGQRAVEEFEANCSHPNWESDIRGDQICVLAFGDADGDAHGLLELARYLKVGWLFSDYNRLVRIAHNRPPVSIMIGMHTGEVALGDFARSIQGARSAEGYMISIAKRVEGCARKGRATQIMLTEPTIAHLGRDLPVGYLRSGDATLTGGLCYPTNEIVEIDPKFGRHVGAAHGLSAVDAQKYLKQVVHQDPSPWHRMLWSQWNRQYAVNGKPDPTSHDLALLANPYAIELARSMANDLLFAGDAWQAKLWINHSEARAGERRYDLAWNNLMRAAADVMIEHRDGSSGNWKQVFAYCASAERRDDLASAAHLIKAICVAENHVLSGDVGQHSRETPEMVLIYEGLDLLRAQTINPVAFDSWSQRVRKLEKTWFYNIWHYNLHLVLPLLHYFAGVHAGTPREKVYRTMLLAPDPDGSVAAGRTSDA